MHQWTLGLGLLTLPLLACDRSGSSERASDPETAKAKLVKTEKQAKKDIQQAKIDAERTKDRADVKVERTEEKAEKDIASAREELAKARRDERENGDSDKKSHKKDVEENAKKSDTADASDAKVAKPKRASTAPKEAAAKPQVAAKTDAADAEKAKAKTQPGVGGSGEPDAPIIKGVIQGVDANHITLISGDKPMRLVTDGETHATERGKNISFKELKSGATVRATYEKKSTGNLARKVEVLGDESEKK